MTDSNNDIKKLEEDETIEEESESEEEKKEPNKSTSINFKKSFKKNKTKSIIKFLFIFLLFSYKIYYPIDQIQTIEENIENIFPKNYNKTNENHYAKEYFQLCQNGKLYGKERYKRSLNPKFTVIVPIYNKQKYITRVLRSIQNQSYKNIEIIFVDDFSKDESVHLIEKYQRKDKRIRLIKHKKNQGTLITRNDGAINARGEYITFVDPDDLLYEGILQKLAGATEMYDADVIRFDAFYKLYSHVKKYDYGDYFKRNKVITQPEIFKQTFYEINGYLYQQNLFLWGKIIRRELFLELLDNLTDYYKKQHWTLYEDNAMDFVLLKYAKTYAFIKENGYIYCYNEESSYTNRNEGYKANRTVKDVFLLAEICFDYTNDNEYEKQMAMFQLRRFLFEYKNSLKKVTKGFEYYYRTLNKFSQCKSILPKHREYIKEIREILQNAEKNAI
jgi:glycosyltransferase involved in cell wall biosynthesis